jgi:hypothetical protein
MTEEQAGSHAEALATSMGITFYVVRSAEGEFMPAQLPLEDCEILATIAPSGRGHGPTLE